MIGMVKCRVAFNRFACCTKFHSGCLGTASIPTYPEYLFYNPATGGRWLDNQQLRKRSWIPALLRAKVRYRNPYQTRHTFASKLLEQGEQEILVANLLGHSTVEMVRRHYGRYIAQAGGVKLKGDYSTFGATPCEIGGKFGANLGQINPGKPVLIRANGKKKTG